MLSEEGIPWAGLREIFLSCRELGRRVLAREGANSVSRGDSFSLGSKLEGGERAY